MCKPSVGETLATKIDGMTPPAEVSGFPNATKSHELQAILSHERKESER